MGNQKLIPIEILKYSEVLAISSGVLTTVLTFVSLQGGRFVRRISCSGQENGKWQIFIDTELQMTKRTVDRNIDFGFENPLRLNVNQVLDIKVTHFGPGSTADFECSLLGY